MDILLAYGYQEKNNHEKSRNQDNPSLFIEYVFVSIFPV